MVTPTREEIYEEALSLFFSDNPGAPNPEIEELKESGYWRQARDGLMRGEDQEYMSYLEEQAHEVGYRLVTESDHNKLIDLERKLESVKSKAAKLKILESQLEKLKNDLDKQGKVKVVTVEKIVKEIKWRNRENRKQDNIKKVIEEVTNASRTYDLGDLDLLNALNDTLLIHNEIESLEDLYKLPTLKIKLF